MSYCHKCGNKGKGKDSFCERCGEKVGEVLQDIEEGAEEIIKKTSYSGFVTFIFILMLIGYIILDIWAASQVSPEISANSLLTTIQNTNGNVGLGSSSASTKIMLENPTFVPIILFPIKYDVKYGSNQIAEGKTDFIFIYPYSSNAVSANIKVSHSALVGSALTGMGNLLTGNKERIEISFYELGIKFASTSL